MALSENESGHDGDSSCSEASCDVNKRSSTGWSSRSPSEASQSQHASTRSTTNLGISENEQNIVKCSRWIFLLCLVSSAAALALAVYFIASSDEMVDFTGQFDHMARNVIEISDKNTHNIVKEFQALALLTTSFLMAERDKHPEQGKGFVTIPAVEEHFGRARRSSGALLIAYLPEVAPSEVDAWNQYSNEKQNWIQESHSNVTVTDSILPSIWADEGADRLRALTEEEFSCGALGHRMLMTEETRAQRVPMDPDAGPFSPVWTFSPPPRADDVAIINLDLRSNPVFRRATDYVSASKLPTFLDICDHASWFDNHGHVDVVQAVIVLPVFDGYDHATSDVVGHLVTIIPWEVLYKDSSPDGSPPAIAVLENTCNQVFTFEIHGRQLNFLGEEDLHDKAYAHMKIKSSHAHVDVHSSYSWDGYKPRTKSIADDGGDVIGDKREDTLSDELKRKSCHYNISVYPTKEFQEEYVTTEPVWFACVILGVFVLTSLLFVVFDCYVRKRTDKVMSVALKQNAIVSSLFPTSVRAKIMAEADQNDRLSKLGKAGIKSFLSADKESGDISKETMVASASKPIADLFPETTIMFADIAGFTAWSSAREPSQVFTLLEGIYSAFDRIAHRRKVFKVEVVGDCYVAVAGLPDHRKDHAMVMAKFALDCLREMDRVTDRLVLELGPDTNHLKMRIGLHSGPVVAGVLRGDKSRFQLFGDTVNTASRMESTGSPNKIQVSQETADLLIAAGKKDWLTQRKDLVNVKGKGELVTFFLNNKTSSDTGSTVDSSRDVTSQVLGCNEADAVHRITEWTAEVMAGLLKEIVACRQVGGAHQNPQATLAFLERDLSLQRQDGKVTVIDEFQEIIELPNHRDHFCTSESKTLIGDVVLDPDALNELREYIRTIAQMYNDNPFHNFEHANHVTMSVVKLLSRIGAPDIEDVGNKSLDDHTYGITADPLTRFAVVFAALIHDVDHSGVSNLQLVKEGSRLATLYNNKSVAEQNSVDNAWNLLMEPQYENLRYTIYSTSAEFYRFRSLVVNAVMATDIMDKDLKKLRNDRWDVAFDPEQDQGSLSAVNRKATIVIEHLIQASDVAHTMQHWHVYRKWNERLFQELYRAYQMGRLESDPSESWYQGELGFFDFYIIPLAKKLKDCGVFGVSSDEYLSYALQNRKEWERRGKTIVDEMSMSVNQENKARRDSGLKRILRNFTENDREYVEN